MLQANIEVCEKDFEGIKVKNADDIVPYREAFRAMGINPNKPVKCHGYWIFIPNPFFCKKGTKN